MQATPSAEIQIKTLLMSDNNKVKVELWDTAGSEKYDSLNSIHCRRAIGAIIVFDLQERNSFKNIPKWINLVKEQADRECQIILVGNKVDLCAGSPALNVQDVPARTLDSIEVNLGGNQYSSSAAATALNNPIRSVKNRTIEHQLLDQVNQLNLDKLNQQ